MLERFLATEAYAYLIILCRLGSIILVVPLYSQGYVSVRIRLLFALTLGAALAPLIFRYIPPLPEEFPTLAYIIISEILIGLMIGIVIYAICTSVVWAGSILSISAGLSNALVFNPAQGEQSIIPAAFLLLAGLAFIYATDLDHLIYIGMMQSYMQIPVGGELFLEDMGFAVARAIADSFIIGFQMAMPFIVFGLVFNVLLGVLSRLLPQFQVFFVMLPLQLLASLALLMVMFPIILNIFGTEFQNRLMSFFNF